MSIVWTFLSLPVLQLALARSHALQPPATHACPLLDVGQGGAALRVEFDLKLQAIGKCHLGNVKTFQATPVWDELNTPPLWDKSNLRCVIDAAWGQDETVDRPQQRRLLLHPHDTCLHHLAAENVLALHPPSAPGAQASGSATPRRAAHQQLQPTRKLLDVFVIPAQNLTCCCSGRHTQSSCCCSEDPADCCRPTGNTRSCPGQCTWVYILVLGTAALLCLLLLVLMHRYRLHVRRVHRRSAEAHEAEMGIQRQRGLLREVAEPPEVILGHVMPTIRTGFPNKGAGAGIGGRGEADKQGGGVNGSPDGNGAAACGDGDATTIDMADCPVCLDDVTDGPNWARFRCGHGVCRGCLFELLKRVPNAKAAKCPTCRLPLVPAPGCGLNPKELLQQQQQPPDQANDALGDSETAGEGHDTTLPGAAGSAEEQHAPSEATTPPGVGSSGGGGSSSSSSDGGLAADNGDGRLSAAPQASGVALPREGQALERGSSGTEGDTGHVMADTADSRAAAAAAGEGVADAPAVVAGDGGQGGVDEPPSASADEHTHRADRCVAE